MCMAVAQCQFKKLLQQLLSHKTNLYTRRWKIRLKLVVYIYNKEMKSEHQPKLHAERKNDTKSQICYSKSIIISNFA
jgi:hypothetical protein